MGDDGRRLPAAVADATNVLVLAPAASEGEAWRCRELSCGSGGAGAGDRSLLRVSYAARDTPTRTGSGAEVSPPRRPAVGGGGAGKAGETGVIHVGVSEPPAGSPSDDDPSATASESVRTVPNPGDLTKLGIRADEFLRRRRTGPGETTVCFDSLTALLRHVDFGTAYEFLHVLAGRTAAHGASTHYHMDPDAHDERTVERVATLTDAVVGPEIDGAASARCRRLR